MSPEEKLTELGIELPKGSAPAANYTNAVRSGNLMFMAGKAPLPINGKLPKGRLGREFNTEQGYQFARSACIDLIAVIKNELGSLDKVARVVEIQGALNTDESFEDHAKVMNGASDLLVQVFGEKGIHARSVFGASSLRSGVPLVLKATVEILDSNTPIT